jgi:3-oxoacyl-[acyl-carrier protein] reductase
MTDLTGRSAIVTGAAQGLGLVTAGCLARAGASVWIADIQGVKAAAAAELLRQEGLAVHSAELDIAQRDPVRQLFDYVAEPQVGWTSWSTMPASSFVS